MARNLVIMVLDSCRFDSFQAAKAPTLNRVGGLERRWAYASWTAPSHYTFFMGLIPHRSPVGVYASEVYKQDFRHWVDRLGVENFEFSTFLPQLSLARVLKQHGYRCVGRVSMPVLNQFTLLSKYFDDYKLMSNHFDFEGIVNDIEFSADQPTYCFLNIGETHYPYMLTDDQLPHISGLHGVAKSLSAGEDAGGQVPRKGTNQPFEELVNTDTMRELHRQQIATVEHVDGVAEALFEKAPSDTYFLIMADHGDCFGEGGYFGHGPVMHEKVFEVPYLEGIKP